jgi:hypothetical protein
MWLMPGQHCANRVYARTAFRQLRFMTPVLVRAIASRVLFMPAPALPRYLDGRVTSRTVLAVPGPMTDPAQPADR